MITAAILMALLLIPASGPPKAHQFTLSITVTEGEHSKDSNSATTSITLRGGRIHYVKTHSGFRAGRLPSIDKEVDAKQEDLDRLKHLIVEKGLARSRSLISAIDQPGRYVEIDASIVAGKKRSRLKVAAMKEKADRDILYDGLRALVDEIEQIVNP
jgi:hypothetical protein